MTETAARAAAEPRAPKQDRSRATRERLLAATIRVLAEGGWPAATVGAVAAAAEVSRGAAQHHFPTREDLITAALEHMFAERMEQVRASGPSAAADRRTLVREVVHTVVAQYTDDMFKAALHAWTAAVSDPALRDRLLPLENRFSREVFLLAAARLDADLDHEPTRRALQTTLDLARGLGLADLLSDDSARRAPIADAWAEHLDAVLRTRTSEGAGDDDAGRGESGPRGPF